MGLTMRRGSDCFRVARRPSTIYGILWRTFDADWQWLLATGFRNSYRGAVGRTPVPVLVSSAFHRLEDNQPVGGNREPALTGVVTIS